MIYDCFLYSGESELLDIRLNTLKNFLPTIQHIAVQSNYTFSGKRKDLHMESHENVQNAFLMQDPLPNPWDNERALRNHILTCLLRQELSDDDVIIISDVDEIPRKEAILQFKPDMGVAFLDMQKFGFFLNLREGMHWTPPKIMNWSHLKTSTPEAVRNAGAPHTIDNAGFHFSWLGGIDRVLAKFASFSHQEEAVQRHANREELIRKMKVGESLWSNDKWEIVPISSDFPQYIQDHQHDSLSHLIFKP